MTSPKSRICLRWAQLIPDTLSLVFNIKVYETRRSHPIFILGIILHNHDVIMSVMASQNTGVLIVSSTVCSSADERKHQSSASLAFVRGIHRGPVNFQHKGPVTRKMFPFDDVTMTWKDCLQPNVSQKQKSSCCFNLTFGSGRVHFTRFKPTCSWQGSACVGNTTHQLSTWISMLGSNTQGVGGD